MCYGYGDPEESVNGSFLFLTPCCATQSVDEMGNEQESGSDVSALPRDSERSGAVPASPTVLTVLRQENPV